MRREPSVLHLDLDAFFAAVEQRDKPSLRARPVVVGGTGGRGVVSTASYEARAFGARSAMPTVEARRLCPPGTAFLGPRFAAYRRTSDVVMALLRELSPLVEPVSIDEAYVDLAAGDHDLSVPGVTALAVALKQRIAAATGGVTGSVGIATSKSLAKIGSELRKPDGLTVVAPGEELGVLHPLPVRSLGGVGPATAERLARIGVRTVGDLHRLTLVDLTTLVGQALGAGLYRLARADDDRPVVADREAKSVSAEETFARDLSDPVRLAAEVEGLARRVGSRLQGSGTSGRTVTLKVRRPDFSTLTRSQTLAQPIDDPRLIAEVAHRLLRGIDRHAGVRLLGVGVSGLATFVQGDLFAAPEDDAPVEAAGTDEPEEAEPRAAASWYPGQDVRHDGHGAGWVWGSGLGRVTVRFEGPTTAPGRVRTLASADPELHPGEPPDWTAGAGVAHPRG